MLLALAINYNYVLATLFFAVIVFGIAMFLMNEHGHGHYAHPYNNYYRPMGQMLTQPVTFELVDKIVHEILQRIKYVEHEYAHLNTLKTNKKTTSDLIKSTQDKLKDERIGLQRQQEKLQLPAQTPEAQRMTVQHVHVYLYDQNVRLENIKKDIARILQAVKEEGEQVEAEPEALIERKAEESEATPSSENKEKAQKASEELENIRRELVRVNKSLDELKEEVNSLTRDVPKDNKPSARLIEFLTKLNDSIERMLQNLQKDRALAEATLSNYEELSKKKDIPLKQLKELFSQLRTQSKHLFSYEHEQYPKIIRLIKKRIVIFRNTIEYIDEPLKSVLNKRVTKFEQRLQAIESDFPQ